MKELIWEIVPILMEIPNITREEILFIINPLGTEEKLEKMLKYLQENKNNKNLMKIDNLIGRTLEITGVRL